MHYRTCCKCGRGLHKPTPSEDLNGGQECLYCKTIQPQALSEKEWIMDLFRELDALRWEMENLKDDLQYHQDNH